MKKVKAPHHTSLCPWDGPVRLAPSQSVVHSHPDWGNHGCLLPASRLQSTDCRPGHSRFFTSSHIHFTSLYQMSRAHFWLSRSLCFTHLSPSWRSYSTYILPRVPSLKAADLVFNIVQPVSLSLYLLQIRVLFLIRPSLLSRPFPPPARRTKYPICPLQLPVCLPNVAGGLILQGRP